MIHFDQRLILEIRRMWRKWLAPGTLGAVLSSSCRNFSSCDSSEESHDSATSVAIISSAVSFDSLRKHLLHNDLDIKTNGRVISDVKLFNDQEVCHIDFNRSILTQCDGLQVAFDTCFIAVSMFPTPVLRQMVESAILKHINGTKIYATTLDDLSEAKQRISKGEHITIVGAYDWSTISFAASLASHARKCGYVNAVTLVYPSFGPLSGVLPRFLSLSLAMRLQSKGVEIAPYSQVRYLGDLISPTNNKQQHHSVLVYLARSYDSINTSAFPTDAIVFGTAPLTQKLRDDRNDYHFTNPFQTALINSDLELDSLSGGILVNKSLQSQHNVFISGYGVNVPFHQYRGVIQGERDAYLSLQTARQVLRGEVKTFQKKYPCHVMSSSELSVSFISFGLCSSALESHSYFWRVPSAAMTNRSDIVTHAVPKPSLSTYMKKDFQDVMSLSSHKAKPDFVPPSMSGPRGRYALYKVNNKKRNGSNTNNSLAASVETGNSAALWSIKNAPLGTGITFYVQDGKIAGILLSGFATNLLYHQLDSSSSGSMHHDRMDQLEEVLGRYILRRVAVDETTAELLDAGTVRLKMVEQIGSDTNQLLDELECLFKSFLVQDEEGLLVKFEDEIKAFRTSARRSYRYCQVARTTVMEMNDHFNKQMVGKVPQRLSENVFQLKSNEGSRSDRMNAAYSSNILQAMMNEQSSNRKS